MKLVNAKILVDKAKKNGYAVAHININNLEWTKAVLEGAQKENSPVIIGVSEGALKYMGGFDLVYSMVKNLIKNMDIKVPVSLHLDHGSYDSCLKAIFSKWSSVMYDGSHKSWEVNYENTKKLIEIANKFDVSVEAEVGSIGGEEDGIVGLGEIAKIEEAKKMIDLGVSFLAAGIGNIHGIYPPNWKSLDFQTLAKLQEISGSTGLVLHGGSGIPLDQIQKAISLGVAKINVNTELQQVNATALKEFVLSGKVNLGKNYDPRKMYLPGYQAMVEKVREKIREFKSSNQA